jgi:hypothetical protein
MTDLDDAVRLLQAKRKELADELDAVDKALAALSRVGGAGSAAPEENPATPERAPNVVLPTKLKPRRTLTDEHKHSLSEGRRKAIHSKAAAAGLARELIDQVPALTASSGDGRQPRLVKRTK